MDKYRKKPVVIEARQFLGGGAGQTPRNAQATGSAHLIYQWIEKNTLGSFDPMPVIEGSEPWPESGVSIDPRDGRMIIATLEGGHWVNPGDWIIKGVQNEFYPIKPDVFSQTYEAVTE